MDFCVVDTTEHGSSSRRSHALPGQHSPLVTPFEVSTSDYRTCKRVEIGLEYRTFQGSVPTAKLAVVAAMSLLGAALLAVLFGPHPWSGGLTGALRAAIEPRREANFVISAHNDIVPALSGVDVIGYRSSSNPPVFGSPEFQYTLQTGEYSTQFWFASRQNRDLFASDPGRYAPRFGGFCSYGISSEMLDGGNKSMDTADVTEGWPWRWDHLGPPADLSVWRILDDRLYFAFLPGVMDIFENDYAALSKQGEARWASWFGSDHLAGPFNVECTADTYGPPVTRTCTFEPQRGHLPSSSSNSRETHQKKKKHLAIADPSCTDALFALCGDHQGDNPVNDNACTTCLDDFFSQLSSVCPSTDGALHASVDKAFCW